MGLFDDIINIAGEVNHLKEDVAGTLNDTVQSLTDVQGEATSTIQEAGQGIEEAKNSIISNLSGTQNEQ